MWWQDLLWGAWNGFTAWPLLFIHILGWWDEFPLYNQARNGNWYDLGFLIGADSLLRAPAGRAMSRGRREREREEVSL